MQILYILHSVERIDIMYMQRHCGVEYRLKLEPTLLNSEDVLILDGAGIAGLR